MRRGVVAGAGLFGWLWFAYVSLMMVKILADKPEPPDYYLVDWNVYWSGAQNWAQGTLYWEPLSLRGMPLPTPFNYPPGAAWLAMPLVPLGHDVGGVVWLALGIAATVASAVIASRWVPNGWVWIGIALMLLTTTQTYRAMVGVGNNNALLLLGLTAFVWAHLARHHRTAGVLLGATVAVKAWPVVLVVLLVRDRRWLTLTWAATFLSVAALASLLWLGPDVTPKAIAAIRTWLPSQAQDVIWTSWLREALGAPSWIGAACAVVLLALPLRGRLGMAAGLVAGVSLINNVWMHYMTTLGLAAVLVVAYIADKLSGVDPISRRGIAVAIDHPLASPRASSNQTVRESMSR